MTYTTTGTYPVTVEYDSSSATPATETDSETIGPYTTATSVGVSYRLESTFRPPSLILKRRRLSLDVKGRK